MSLVVCPRCKAPNDAPADASGRQRCMICNHLWQPQVSVAMAVPAPNATAARPLRPRSTRISQEYLPDDPANEAGRALTTRQSADASGEKRPANERGKEGGGPELKPHSDRSHGGVIPPLKALPSKDEPLQIDDPPAPSAHPKSPPSPARQPMSQPRVSPSTPTVEVDMDLFDRLEKEAQVNRSKQRTVAELTFEPPSSNPAPPSNGQTMACPVCGHTFVATSAARAQTCPQCHTTFDHASGRFATASSGGGGDPLIGRNLRGCVIDRKLGEGGMGSVYHAKQLSLDRSVAIKVLPPDLARNRNFIQRFEREAKSLAKINHPNILHIYDFGEEGSLKLYFMIIEFVDGTDLGEVLNRRTTLPQLEVLDLLRQAALGLEMAAAKGVIHRDIKPDNLMIAGDGICKVSDFGLAKGYGEENEVTSIGVRVGTPAFMSPEQCDGVEVDWRSDVYNLGCTAFLSLTGRLPFDGETPFSIMLKHKNDPIPSVRDISPSVEPAVDSLIKRMLAKRPPDRCDSWKALIDEIEDIEMRLSGDPNSMRKSRAQLQALGQRPSVPAPQLEEIRLPSPGGRPPSSANRDEAKRDGALNPAGAPKQLPDWLKPVDVPASPVATSKDPESPPTPQPASGSPVGRGSTSSANHRAIGPEAVGRSSKLNAELVAAKDRGLRSEAESLAASAERLFSAGRFDEAAKDFRKASELTPDTEYAGQLHNRSREARSRGRLKRIVVRLTFFLILCGLIAVALFFATPWIHNLLASKQHQEIKAEYRDAKDRDAALVAFAQAQKPYQWYQLIFHTSYTVSAANEAEAEVDEDVLQHNQPVTPVMAVDNPDIKNLEAAFNDLSVSLPEVVDRSQALMKNVLGADRSRVHDVLLRAQSKIDELTPLLRQIEALVAKGRNGAALAMAKDFRANHPRAGRLGADLPLPAMLSVQSEDGHGVDAAVRVDGIQLPAGEHLLCRRGNRDVVVEISSPGFATQTLTLPADASSDETAITIKLKTAPLWTRQLGRGLGGRSQLHLAQDGVYVQREDGMALLRETDGLVLGTLEPLAGIQGPSYTPLWWMDPTTNHVVIGGVDGLVEAIDSRSMQPQQTLYQGKADVLAWLDVSLTFKAGKIAHYLVEESHGNRRLVALDGAIEWWRYQSIPGVQPPFLSSALDKVVVVDDSIIHLIDEDGSADLTQPLSAARSGPVLALPKDLGVLVPTVNGVQWVRFGTQQQPITISDDAALLAAGPGAIALSGKNLAIAHADGVELLDVEADHATSRWKIALDATPVEIGVGESVVALSDNKGRLLMLSLATGGQLARINLPAALNAAPLVTTSEVVVTDIDGNVASYIIHQP